jgi:hypothetical protein
VNTQENESGAPIGQAVDRRRTPRYEPEALAGVLSFGSDWHIVSIRDIGFGGARIIGALGDLKDSDRCYLTTSPNGHETVTMECRVVHIHDEPGQRSAGVEFLEDGGDADDLLAHTKKLGGKIRKDQAAALKGTK